MTRAPEKLKYQNLTTTTTTPLTRNRLSQGLHPVADLRERGVFAARLARRVGAPRLERRLCDHLELMEILEGREYRF